MNANTAANVNFQYRAPGTPVTGDIHYAIGSCGQGAVLVARSKKGICAIFMDDEKEGLESQLRLAFPGNRLEEAASELGHDLNQVVAFIDGPVSNAQIDLELDVGGTFFQQQVWQALSEIPYGTTSSYAEIAEQLGSPESVRAVAGACAANVLAVAIPCHRVVRSDGSPSGYRWGETRKLSLQQLERQAR